MDLQDAAVALIVLAAGAFLWRRLRPRRSRPTTFIPLSALKPRSKKPR